MSGSTVQTRPLVRWRGAAAVAATVALVAWFYWWTVLTTAEDVRIDGPKRDYYNLLVDGFQQGHLWMDAKPDPELLKLPPEQRPGRAPYLLDASLYRDRYYLYFGVAPVVLLFWPFAALTGNDLPVAVAALVLALAALAVSLLWWREMRRRFFPALGRSWDMLAVLALGLCTVMPSTLRRPLFYEVAITAGWVFGALMLWALARAARSPRPARWLVAAGIACGLAIGSRANLAPVALLALTLGAWLTARVQGGGMRRAVACVAFAAAGAAPIGAGLAGYNYARFGSVLEFGHSYQLGLNPQRMFRGTNLAHNIPLYYFAPPQLSVYFPFLAPAEEPPKPVDYIGREHVHGEFAWVLVAALAAVSALAARRWRALGEFALAALPVAVWFGGNLLVTSLTGVRANRYMLDFHPALVWLTLGVCGLAFVERRTALRVLAAGSGLFVLGAALFNVLASMQVHGFFATTDQARYRETASRADAFVARLAPGLFKNVGDQTAELQWPAEGAGGRHPLLSAGATGFDDGVWVDFDGGRRARFVYQHWEYGTAAGEWFDFQPGARSRVRVTGAFLLPPVRHAWYGARTADERAVLKRRLRIAVDGQLRFERDVPSHDTSPTQVRWGSWRIGRSPDAVFPGRILAPGSTPLDDSWVAARLARAGTIRLSLTLPRDRFGLAEPLVVTGGYPRCDMLYVIFTRPGFVRLVHDRFSAGDEQSEEFAVDYQQPQFVEVELPFARDPLGWTEGDRIELADGAPPRVRWNGREVLVLGKGAHPSTPAEIVLGANLVQASGARRSFAGEMLEGMRLRPLHTAASGALDAPAFTAATFRGTRGTIIAWRRGDGSRAAIVWRRDTPAAAPRLGWADEDRVVWSGQTLDASGAALHVELPQARLAADEKGRGLLEVEQGGKIVLTALTDFFTAAPAEARALEGEWRGTALRQSAEAAHAPTLPGRVRLRFSVPEDGFLRSQPLLLAGKAGAADSVYLRPVGGGRYVAGIDHWGYGGAESAPFALPPGVHTVVMELATLLPGGARQGVRVWVNDALVLNEPNQALHPVQPADVVFARNPAGMSTSGEKFEGTLYSVRTDVPTPQ
ncbi:MAG: hypothetical protein HZA32_18835 [Opitutae bacterium]|nr:hypothetical protein [Opitutae bacterium]